VVSPGVARVPSVDPKREGAAERPSGFSSRLLSVVLWVEDKDPLLDECLFAVAGQSYRPLELIVVGRRSDRQLLNAAVEQYSKLEPFEHQVLLNQSYARAEALSEGMAQAHGRYLAFLTADQVVYPDHYARLIQKLSELDSAWAMSGFVRAYLDKKARGAPFIQWKQEHPAPESFDLLWYHYNRPVCSSVVIDRTRVGKFPLAFSNDEGPIENDPLFFKLAAAFRPALVLGIPSCEQRMSRARTVFERSPELAKISVPQWPRLLTLRLRVLAAVDRGKTRLRLQSPFLYRVAKGIGNWSSRVISRRSLREHFNSLSRGGS